MGGGEEKNNEKSITRSDMMKHLQRERSDQANTQLTWQRVTINRETKP